MRSTFPIAACLPIVLAAGSASGLPVGPGDFGVGAIVESFEAIEAGPNAPLAVATDIVAPGYVSPYTFDSGLVLTEPVPNDPVSVLVLDYAKPGGTQYAMPGTGTTNSAADVPFGAAYLIGNGTDVSIDLALPGEMLRAGAYVTSASGTITLTALGAGDAVLESVSVSAVDVESWGSNFVGIQNAAGIQKLRFEGSFLAVDGVTFQAVPEPAPAALLALGLAALALRKPR